MINKYYVAERYCYDTGRALLHDLKGTRDPDNRQCGLSAISDCLLFDAKSAPEPGAEVKVKTPGGKKRVVIAGHCPHCL